MLKSAAGKVMWVGRATVFLVGLAVILAIVLGVASTALAHGGYQGLLHLGHSKSVTNTTTLVGNILDTAKAALVVQNTGGGSALGLQVNAGQAPLTVNAEAGKATNLNADKLDGKDSTQIGVNGLEMVTRRSAESNSVSSKAALATCPLGKVVVGTGYGISGGRSGNYPYILTDVVVTTFRPSTSEVYVEAYEEEATSVNWSVTAYAICATAP